MNNCLADLSRLIPTDYLKKGRGRIEKTEIIEMAIKHMKHLQAHSCCQLDTCELAQQHNQEERKGHRTGGPIIIEHYRLGYQECLSEAMHFLVEVEGFFAGDPLCLRLINHLQKHCDKILKGDRLNFPHTHHVETTSNHPVAVGVVPTAVNISVASLLDHLFLVQVHRILDPVVILDKQRIRILELLVAFPLFQPSMLLRHLQQTFVMMV